VTATEAHGVDDGAPVPGGSRPAAASPEVDAVLADPKRAWRLEPTARKRAFAVRHGVPGRDLADPERLDDALEAVVGSPDFLPCRWLRLGVAVADAVARVETPTEFGTGFLVSPWLLMTNNHVISDADTAARSAATFRYMEDADGRMTASVRLALQPERCFLTSPDGKLDLTLVAVAATADGKGPGGTFGCVPAKAGTGKILLGMPVNILQHPEGRSEEIAFRNNLLVSLDNPTTLTYATDTEPGSSGSPVLNDSWELVALHHRQARTISGQLMGNEGIRISAIVTEVADRVAKEWDISGSDAKSLLQEFLSLGGVA